MAGNDAGAIAQPTSKEIRLVIGASSLGTIFEWYDFFIYGTLSAIIGRTFFPSGNETLQTLLVWAGFAVGFGFRPLGAILFGFLGDRLGRKYTFLVTVTLMGIATAGVGFVPSAASIGIAAPILIILLRVCQGLALGGEYGGAAIYVSEHAPDGKRGFYTSFIQASVVGGFILSLIVVLSCKALMPEQLWNDWGWRVPFLLSIALLAVSLYMRLKLSESPVFKAMKAQGEIAGNPFIESFTYPGNKKRIFVALFGIASGLTVVWYTAMFSTLEFLKKSMRVEQTTAEILVGVGVLLGGVSLIYFGSLSDRIGRKKPIMWGYVASLLCLIPLFHVIGANANPALTLASERAPVTVSGPDCSFSPFASEQKTDCGKLLGTLTNLGVSYSLQPGDTITLRAGETVIADTSAQGVQTGLEQAGYNFEKVVPAFKNMVMIVLALVGLSILSGATYGPVAALLSEMFPPKIRYSSMSIPYHFGTGYFGGFLPFIASFIIAKTGNHYAGLWYTIGIVIMSLLVCLWGLKETKDQVVD